MIKIGNKVMFNNHEFLVIGDTDSGEFFILLITQFNYKGINSDPRVKKYTDIGWTIGEVEIKNNNVNIKYLGEKAWTISEDNLTKIIRKGTKKKLII